MQTTESSQRSQEQKDTSAVSELRGVSKSYRIAGGIELKVLDSIDLEIKEGELLALLGQSGSGKSTILRCLTGLTQPTSGVVVCYGKPLHRTNPYASIVFQTFALYPWLNVEQNVGVGLMARRLKRPQRDAAIARAIDLIGLENYRAAYPRELSGGMRQRVGIARALVSEPTLLCLDEAFSALDVLTAETLRQEMISLWHQGRESGLKSIFMVTHNIEEAVEMATRICVLFPNPGRLGCVVENQLPYPRDWRDPRFQELVLLIREAITTQTLPDLPAEPPAVVSRPVSRTRSHMESIPRVSVGQILGLLSIVEVDPTLTDIFDISHEIGRDFGGTIALVKAAEILEFVDTPKNDVYLTPLGKRFIEADRELREQIFADQVRKLRLFHIILAQLQENEEVESEQVLHQIASALPYDNPEKTLETMIAWGRYAGLIDYDSKSGKIFAPE
jgi:NitT/TauT family transport system ATP-binding protein